VTDLPWLFQGSAHQLNRLRRRPTCRHSPAGIWGCHRVPCGVWRVACRGSGAAVRTGPAVACQLVSRLLLLMRPASQLAGVWWRFGEEQPVPNFDPWMFRLLTKVGPRRGCRLRHDRGPASTEEPVGPPRVLPQSATRLMLLWSQIRWLSHWVGPDALVVGVRGRARSGIPASCSRRPRRGW
jgi:hypothetical protein